MNYVLINDRNEVLKIKKDPIGNTNPLFRVATLDSFVEGDELSFYIIINNVDELNNVTSYSAVAQSPYVKSLLETNSRLQSRILELETVILDAVLGGKL